MQKPARKSRTSEQTDLQATGKPNFNMLLNGKPVIFTKADDEKFIFDTNKLTWDQNSTVTVNTDIRPMLEEYAKVRAEAERSRFSHRGVFNKPGGLLSA